MTHHVAIIFGSQSDWPVMQHAALLLDELSISFHAQVVSAHRTPDLLSEFAKGAKSRGFKVIIAGAGGAAHLPGMAAAQSILPVIGVPIPSSSMQNGLDALLSIAQMPGGVPVATMAIGKAGAKNAALMAASILATQDSQIEGALMRYRQQQTEKVLNDLEVSIR